MNKLRTLLTLLVVSICAVQSAWADRSAPELPAAVAPVSGQSYYLYNVMEQKFLCRSTTSTSYAAVGTYGDKITITATANENEYTIQWASNNYYLYANDSYVSSSSSKNGKTSMFTVAESAKGYTIQRSPTNTSYYKADEYIGFNGNNGDRLNPALAEGSIHWTFLPVDEAEYYMAKHKLYTYLNAADSYNFYITQYENVYNDPASTTEQLNEAQETLNDALTISTNFVSPDWTDYPILLQNGTANKWTISSGTLRWSESVNGPVNLTSRLTGTVNVDEPVTLVYKYRVNDDYTNLRVYLDGELVQTIANNVSNSGDGRRYYIELPIGNHDVTWEAVFNLASGYKWVSAYIEELGIEKTPTWTPATTTVEGQLGTEVLKLTDNIANVRKIVINGVIGADDWTTIGMMKNAFSIDMSGATATAGIPKSLFRNSNMPFLHSIKLPQGLTTIGDYAFDGSDIEDITFPNTLQSIGNYAFHDSKIKGAYMPNSITNVCNQAFGGCKWLENASWSSAAATIDIYCFYNCINLRTFEIPEGVTTISHHAFCNAQNFNPRFPSTLTSIDNQAFYNSGIDDLVIPESVTFIDGDAFSRCNNLISVTLPTSYYKMTYSNYYYQFSFVRNCPKLKDVYFKSPTVVDRRDIDFFSGCTAAGLTLHVPSFLVSSYKLDPYWYNYNPTGFSTTEITDWILQGNVTLNAGERLEGTPNVTMWGGSTLTINGDDAMTLNNFQTNVDGTNNSTNRAMIIGNTNNISITGDYTYRYYTNAKKWYFITLPFDVKVSNITSPGCSKAVRYYDGAARAANGTGGNWKNYAADDVIPAGTGFIYQTSADCWSEFVAENNAAKNYVFSKNEFVKSLAANASEVTANKGWNLVGNPWLSYYNIHKLNFTAPITVWNNDYYNPTYVAYSIIDDDYAILPSQAFFVQCPDEVNSISFPIDGRQLTSVIESQVGAREFGEAVQAERKLIDIELSNGEMTDKTRFVLNPQAKMDYETSCDASKFFSMDANVPQVYTIENGTQMAINERPAGDGIVKIGLLIPAGGIYTFKSERNQLTDAVLVDLQNGVQTNLSAGSYTFNAEAGTMDSRFELHLSANDVTGIHTVNTTKAKGENEYYNLNGQRIAKPAKGIYVVNGKKVINK